MLLAAAVVVGWVAYQFVVPSVPKPYFVPFWLTEYEKPEIPPVAWLAADQSAIEKARVFTNVDRSEQAADSPARGVFIQRLDELAGRQNDDAVVVYLAGYAIVDHDGRIQILAKDSAPYLPDSQLPLHTVLDKLKKCGSKKKLLVLDIMRGMSDPRDVGGTADGVADLLRQELESEIKPSRQTGANLLVIASCSPGQLPQASESLRRSVFGYFFERALTGSDPTRNPIAS
jgi:hypothetical protein